MKNRATKRTSHPRVWLLMLVLLACALGSNQPIEPVSTGDGPHPGALGISCPAYDPSVFPAPLGVSPTSATLPTMPGSFAVSRTGEATYSIPLLVSPGIAGMAPSLAIAYGSSAGEGFLGVGFSLRGLGAVTRCPANQAQDGFIRPVKYDEQDHLCLDGARLVEVAEQLAFDGSSTHEYRTVPDTFTKVLGHFAPGLGPQTFEAYTKAGRIVEYGSTVDSRAMARSGVVAAWWTSRERDRHENTVRYVYANDVDPADGHTLEITPLRIAYAYRDDHTPSREVVLASVTSQTPSTYYSGGMKLRRSQLLGEVRMITQPGEAVVRSYHLAYKAGEGTGRALLTSVKECAGETGPCKPETHFAWSSHPSAGVGPHSGVATGPWTIAGDQTRTVADVNGDGLPDLIVSWANPSKLEANLQGVSVSLNQGTSFGPWKPWLEVYPPHDQPQGVPFDYNQDGRADLLFYDTYFGQSSPDTANPDLLVLQANPDGSATAIDTGVFLWTQWRLGDLDGDGVADLLQCGDPSSPGAGWTVNLWSPNAPNGPGFDPIPIPIPALAATPCGAIGDKELRIVDLDGAGKPEIVVPSAAYYTDPSVKWSADGTVVCGGQACLYDAVSFDGATWTLVHTNLPVHTLSLASSSDSSASAVVGSSLLVATDNYDGKKRVGETVFVDVNGDGLPDAVRTGYGDGRPRTFMNTGAGFAEGVPSLNEPPLPHGYREDRFARFATLIDDDGDGRTDLLVPMPFHCADPLKDTACWVVWRAVGDGTFTVRDTGIYFPEVEEASGHPGAQNVQVLDVDGDGRHDILALVGDPLAFKVYKNDGPQDLLVWISDSTNPLDPVDYGFVPSVSIHYGNLVDEAVTHGIAPATLAHDDLTYVARSDPANDCDYPRACVVGPGRVVRSYVVNNGQNEKRQFYVKYRDGRYHRLGRGFLGFGERIVIDGDTAGGTAELYDNITYDATFDTFPFAGQVVRSWAWSATKAHWLDPGQVEMTFTARLLQQVPTNQGSTYFTLPVSTSVTRQEDTMQPGSGKSVLRFVKAAEASPVVVLGQSSSAVLDHDDYGNVLYESSDAEGVDLHNTVTRTYDNDPATWLVGLMKTEEACSTSLARTQCRSTQLDHDGHGEVKSATVGDPADPGTLLTMGVWRDAFGHVTLTTADDAFGHHRWGCVSYDADHLFPYASGDALGHVAYTRFDPALGVLTAAVDANGLVTRWQRDAFGSVTEELRADGTRTTVDIKRTKDGGPQAKWFNARVTTEEEGGVLSMTELDAVGRPVHSWTVAAKVQSCGAVSCAPFLQLEQETTYDLLGRVSRATLPWMSQDSLQGKMFHAYAYDASGRVIKHTEPWGRVTSFAYAGHVASSTDWLGTSAVEADELGRTVKATDQKGYTTETTYGPFGARWMVKRTGGEITVSERDAYGRVVREVDPDRGETDTAFDGFGEVITMDDALTDPQPRHYAFAYDDVGRLVQRDDPDGTVRWEYDTAANGIGKIARVTSPLSVKQYAYDTLSRPATLALALTDTGDELQAGFGYDSHGRLHTIAYPEVAGVDPLVVRREYDAYGNVVAVHDNANGKVYWRLGGLDGAGRPAVETMGSGVTARRDYDPHTGLVQHIRAGARDAPLVEDLVYTYDKSLRMASRADRLQVSPQGVRTEAFEHDVLGRLTCGVFLDAPAGHKLPAHLGPCDTALAYDPSGNITSKSDVGAYTYAPDHPHAVQTAGSGSYGYDAVGNQITRPDAGITWTAFDLPLVVTPTNGDAPVTFAYDGDQRRIRKQSAAQETVYFEDLYERVTSGATGGTVHRYYVAAGSATVVLTRQAGGSDRVAYLYTDALGSTDVVTDGAGQVTGNAGERRSYDAFGARRSPAWGQTAPAGGFASKASPMGFTGHEGDDDLGLINMRGRIYDPRLGRFLSTDPIVSRPHFGQSWNPYSYVLNSPLNFVDPSGFDEVGTYANLGGVQGQFPVADVRGMFADPSSGAAPVVKPPSSTGDTWIRTQTKDASVDDKPQGGVAGVPQAVSEGSPFAQGGMGAAAQPNAAEGGYDFAGRARGFGQAVGGFFSGLALGSVPYAGAAAQVAMNARLLDAGTREARFGLALGELVGGVFSVVGGVGGEVLGGAASATGFGAAVGVPAIAVSTTVVVGGVANAAAGVQGLLQVLTSTGSGSNGNAPKAGTSGGPGAGRRFPEGVKDTAEQRANGKCVFCGRQTTRTRGPAQRNTDHAVPKSRGGDNTVENAQNTCRDCNLDKGAKTTEEYLLDD